MWSYTCFYVIFIYFSVISEFVRGDRRASDNQQLVSSRTHTDVGPNHRTKVTTTVYRSNNGISYHQVIDQHQHQHHAGGGRSHTNNRNTQESVRSEQHQLPSQQHVYATARRASHSQTNEHHEHEHHTSNLGALSNNMNPEKLIKNEQTNVPSQQHVYRRHEHDSLGSQKHKRHVRDAKHTTSNRNTEEFVRNERNHLPSQQQNHHNNHRVSNAQGHQQSQHHGSDARHSTNSDNTEFIKSEQPNHHSNHGATHIQGHNHQTHGSDARHPTNTDNREFIKNEQPNHHSNHGATHPQGHQHQNHGINAQQPTNENTELIRNEQDSSSRQHNHRGNSHGASHPQAHQHGNSHGVHHHRGSNASYENAADLIENERYVESPTGKDTKGDQGRVTSTTLPTSTKSSPFRPKTEIVIQSPVRDCPAGAMRDWSGRCRSIFN